MWQLFQLFVWGWVLFFLRLGYLKRWAIKKLTMEVLMLLWNFSLKLKERFKNCQLMNRREKYFITTPYPSSFTKRTEMLSQDFSQMSTRSLFLWAIFYLLCSWSNKKLVMVEDYVAANFLGVPVVSWQQMQCSLKEQSTHIPYSQVISAGSRGKSQSYPFITSILKRTGRSCSS